MSKRAYNKIAEGLKEAIARSRKKTPSAGPNKKAKEDAETVARRIMRERRNALREFAKR
jgi:hypothetical protein